MRRVANAPLGAVGTLRRCGTPKGPPGVPSTLDAVQSKLRVAVYIGDNIRRVALGVVEARIADGVYAVRVDLHASPVIEVGSRVFVSGPRISDALPRQPPPGGERSAADEENNIYSALVARVNGNGTYGLLYDDDVFERAASRERITVCEGRSRMLKDEHFHKLHGWVRAAGVQRNTDTESTASILFHRGWRCQTMYLLDTNDVHCLSFLNKAVRMGLLEKAEWEREQHRQRRDLLKERLKESEWRYVLTKYSGVVSACIAMCGVFSVFMWNLKNWQKQQRWYQVRIAADAMMGPRADDEFSFEDPQRRRWWGLSREPKERRSHVSRPAEEARLSAQLSRLDVNHPRILFVCGLPGCGKSVLLRRCTQQHRQCSAVFVNGRESEPLLRSIVKALGITNVDVCGDLTDFLAEACAITTAESGMTPLFVVRVPLTDGKFGAYFEEAVSLACGRRLCHVVMECDVRRLTPTMAALPYADFHLVPTLQRREAVEFLGRAVDVTDVDVFLDIVGTNTTDLDDLALLGSQGDPLTSAVAKLERCVRSIRALFRADGKVRAALAAVASESFDEGLLEVDAVEVKKELHDLPDIVYYDALSDAWKFSTSLHYFAVKCLV